MEKIVEKIVNYFEDNEDVFNDVIEELDNVTGYLDEDRYYPMSDLIDTLYQLSPDSLMSIIDDLICGSCDNGKFNIYADYYRHTCYGFESAESRDYFSYIEDKTVLVIYKNRSRISSISRDIELETLFDEMDEVFSEM